MKFLVEFRLKPGERDAIFQAFEQRGPNRNPGVRFEGAWIARNSEIAFALVEGLDEAHVAKAAESWSQFGQSTIHSVIDVQQY